MKFLISLLFLLTITLAKNQDERFTQQREEMVEKQIINRGISDRKTINAMRDVPRHLFVPQNLVDVAYNDTPLSIGYGQTISQPYIVALMTQTAEPGERKKVLEVGTGSGYQAAILAQIVDSVFTIEIVDELAKRSSELLRKLEYNNIVVKSGDGYKGWPEHSPFDIIIVTAAPEQIPEPLIDQLAENGRMVIPVGDQQTYQELILAIKRKGKITTRKVASVRFVPFVRSSNY
ncbi:MAG TPA: protein-L-isoaspartate(D-aspartate) O-methyltransferase [Bacteroidales bacterium]|nr:protein-L-isoaspartate(D-aspartate) O-methyltransferase [Bacteroidales bacterium]